MSNKPSSWAKHKSRLLIVQGLYRWQMTLDDPRIILEDLLEDRSEKKLDHLYMQKTLINMINHIEDIDNAYTELLDKGQNQLSEVDRSIVRLGVYELLYEPQINPSIVIKESILLADRLSSENSYQFIHAVLNRLIKIIHDSK